jgi:predicted metal-dependent hydrolase
MEQLVLGDLVIEVVRKKIKNIHLSVYPPTGRLRLAAPDDTDEDALRLFAISKISWIKKNQRKFARQERQSERIFETRESHYVEGKRYLLRVTEINGPSKIEIRTKQFIDLSVRPGASLVQRQVLLNEWLRLRLKAHIPPMVEKWEKIIGVKVSSWAVKQMRTKWGACNIEKNRIWLNLELAKKPLACLEYVVVHEMVHLLERHHNEIFQGYMTLYMPDWKAIREELNSLPLTSLI